jgi:hypothetical protein
MTAVAAPDGFGQQNGFGQQGGVGRHVSLAAPQTWRLHWTWHWPTPARVKTEALAAVVLAVALAALTVGLLGQLQGEFAAIGQTDAPEAEATTGVYFALTDMDGSAANVLLFGSDATLASDKRQDLSLYASDQTTVSRDIDQAVVADTGNAAAQRRLSLVLDRIGQYEALIADAELLSQQAHYAAGQPPSAVSAYYKQATDLMQTGILPQVSALTTSGDAGMNAAYGDGKANAISGAVWVVALGVLLVAVLIALQVLLAVRFRRLINPALALVTVLAVAVTAVTGTRFYAEYTHLHVARYDSFESIQALSMARAVSNDANADESRFLVDPAHTAQYQQAFLDKSQEIVDVGNVSYAGYLPALNADIAAYQRNNADIRFGGYLGTEVRNITFPGEGQAALAALLAFQHYEADDVEMRSLVKTDLPAGIAFDFGIAPNESDGAFNAYAAALQADITINSAAFTQAVADGSSDASGAFLAVEALAVLLMTGLIFAGVRPRLAEYRR